MKVLSSPDVPKSGEVDFRLFTSRAFCFTLALPLPLDASTPGLEPAFALDPEAIGDCFLFRFLGRFSSSLPLLPLPLSPCAATDADREDGVREALFWAFLKSDITCCNRLLANA